MTSSISWQTPGSALGRSILLTTGQSPACVHREIGVGQGLRFNALGGIHHKNRASQAARERETS